MKLRGWVGSQVWVNGPNFPFVVVVVFVGNTQNYSEGPKKTLGMNFMGTSIHHTWSFQLLESNDETICSPFCQVYVCLLFQ